MAPVTTEIFCFTYTSNDNSFIYFFFSSSRRLESIFKLNKEERFFTNISRVIVGRFVKTFCLVDQNRMWLSWILVFVST